MKVTAEVLGLKELGEALKQFDIATQAKAIRGALRQSVKPIAREAKKLLDARQVKQPSPTGLRLSDAVAVSAPKPTSKRGAVAGIKMLSKKVSLDDDELESMFGASLQFRLPGFRWHWVEYGVGTVPAQPFLRPAFDTKSRQSVEVFKKQLAKLIEKAKKKAAQKGAIKK